jgi:hypothetical protein
MPAIGMQIDVEALKELFGDEATQAELEAQLEVEAGTFENADDPQAIGTVVWTVRTYRARC